jgi:3-dehydroquinate dehydratase-1
MTNATTTPAIVGVILSTADLWRAIALRTAPDLFELRLDALAQGTEEISDKLGKLRMPLIVTARHPSEGGSNRLRSRERRALLLRFMPHAAYVDVELRSARAFANVLEEARARNIGTIVSFHDLKGTPTATRFEEIVRTARSLGADILKVATRTDSPVQLTRLRDFFWRHRGKMEIEMAVMGIGRLGRSSRLEFAAAGSALNYAHLGTPRLEGQLSITELRQALKQKSARTKVRLNSRVL